MDSILLAEVQLMWWANPTNHNSLRLSKVGHKWLTTVAKISSYLVDLGDHVIYPRQLIQLERQFESPYFVKTTSKLVVYGESDFIMLQLHAGDLPTYLNNLESSKL